MPLLEIAARGLPPEPDWPTDGTGRVPKPDSDERMPGSYSVVNSGSLSIVFFFFCFGYGTADAKRAGRVVCWTKRLVSRRQTTDPSLRCVGNASLARIFTKSETGERLRAVRMSTRHPPADTSDVLTAPTETETLANPTLARRGVWRCECIGRGGVGRRTPATRVRLFDFKLSRAACLFKAAL
jgi:hypothetical protein